MLCPTSRLLVSVLCGALAVAGCGGSQVDSTLEYGEQAAVAYAEALDEFYDEDCLEAEPMLQEVRRKYPYSRFAALSELRLADCQYMESQYEPAIQAYQQFVRSRPSHVEVGYANFQIALCHHAQIPSEWLLSPPAHERDQYHAQEALRLLRRFILDFPSDPMLERGKKLAFEVLELLAAHELYVAKFYLRQDQLGAASSRLRTLLNSYPGSSMEPDALLLLGETYRELEDRVRAQRTLKELVDRFPRHEAAEEARERLAELGG
jgi:outer membrane protein assembly factor BamD